MRITIHLTEIHKIGIYELGLIERKTKHYYLISKNEIVYDVVFIFSNLCIPKKYFHV